MAQKNSASKPRTAAKKRAASKKGKATQGKTPISRALIVWLSVGAALVAAVALYLLQSGNAVNCVVSDKLVNSCRPWIGATSASYGKGNWKSHIDYFEKRAGQKVDVVHSYHSPTQTSLNADEKAFVNRANTLLYMNWKPDTYWAPAGGNNATVNTRIDQMATSIKGLGSKKVFLTVYHEPENDISKGGSKCSRSVGNKGTTAQYRAMWKNVRKRFDAKGVKNVVWVMNYMGWSGWDCAVKDLWPGNDLVDWITWDPYTNDKSNFSTDMSRFYNFLKANTDASHDFTAKPWGIAEMGYEGSDQGKAYRYYDDMQSAIKSNKFPNLKMYLFFDMNGRDFGGDASWDARVGYARNGKADTNEQKRFNAMLKSITSLAPRDAAQPAAITITTPTQGATIKGKVTVSGKVPDPSKVKIVTLRVDGKWVATDESNPYSFTFDTRGYRNGTHSIILRVMDRNGNKTDSAPMSVTIKN